MLSFVAAGLGIALIAGLILETTSHPGVVTLPVDPPSKRTVYTVTTPDLQRVPAVASTLQALCRSAQRIRGGRCLAAQPELSAVPPLLSWSDEDPVDDSRGEHEA